MTVYTFFCCKPDGSAPSFEAYDLPTDEAAVERSRKLLGDHDSCSHVLVCDGDRDVAATARPGFTPPPADPAPQRKPRLPASLQKALANEAIEAAGAALIATTHDGAVVYWNAAATRLYGWEADEALGRNVIDVTPALQSREEAQTIMGQLQRGEPWEGEIVLRRRDGTPFRAFVANVPANADGVIVGVSATAARRKTVSKIKPLLIETLGG